MKQRVLGGTHRGRVLASVELASLRQQAFRLLRHSTLEQRVDFSVCLAIFGHRGLWKAVKQGHRSGDVLACPSEVREGPIVGEDPLVYNTGRGACVPTVSATLHFLIDLPVLPNKLLSGIIDL